MRREGTIPTGAPRISPTKRAGLALRGGGGQAGLHLAREMRDDAEDALDEHELSPVVHFVFFDGENHFEAAFGWRSRARGHLHLFGKKTVGESLNPSGPFLARATKQLQNLVLAAGFFFFRHETLHE